MLVPERRRFQGSHAHGSTAPTLHPSNGLRGNCNWDRKRPSDSRNTLETYYVAPEKNATEAFQLGILIFLNFVGPSALVPALAELPL